MSRLALFTMSLSLAYAAACSKSAGSQDKVSSPPPASGGAGEVIAVPRGAGPSMGRAPEAAPVEPAQAANPPDARFTLKPQEGKLAIVPPADARAGAEAIARITVTPGAGYHVNTEYPIKLTLTSPTGVALAKTEFIAGGHTKAKGDAEALDDNQLSIAVKLTPATAGSYTINGSFKFAVCDKDQCLAKKETIAIAVAAK
jgi:hypothetical protein